MKLTTLSSGMRIISESIDHVRTVSLGIWVPCGSVWETAAERGMSHFLEHMFFKGTDNRTAREIVEAFDDVGGELNAYTSKEYTCFYAKVIDEHLPMALDVLLDMLFSPSLRQADVDKEKQVVLEEIAMYEDSPDELVHDLLAGTLWPDHPLGSPILGRKETISGLSHQQIISYYERQYSQGGMVISAAGRLDHDLLVEMIEKRLPRAVSTGVRRAPTSSVPGFCGDFSVATKQTEQTHLCLGFPGIAWGDVRIYTLNVLNNVLGSGMSSRLFQSIREEMGLAYSIYSYSSSFVSGGYFALYAGLSSANLERIIAAMGSELKTLRSASVAPAELARAKQQVKGGLIIGMESTSTRMSRMGRGILLLDRVTPLEEIVERIEAVSALDVEQLALEVFQSEKLAACALGPLEPGTALSELFRDAL